MKDKHLNIKIESGKLTAISFSDTAERDLSVIPILPLFNLITPVINLVTAIVNAKGAATREKKRRVLIETDSFKALSDSDKWKVISTLI